MRDYYIYKITNKINGKAYIGQHLIPEKGEQFRWYMGRGIAIQKALKKYGRQNFKKEILEYVKDDLETHLKVSDREIFWIKYYNTLYPNGYNLTPGGEGGCTEESAKKQPKHDKKEDTNIQKKQKEKCLLQVKENQNQKHIKNI